MIILDTNVISEVMAAAPSPAVAAWMNATPTSELATTTINVSEVRFGLARLPFGRRRAQMEMLLNSLMSRAFENRVLPFDLRAAEAFSELALLRERSGRPLRGFDGLIAAIAASRGLPIATRDVGGFAGCGISIVNPWDAALA